MAILVRYIMTINTFSVETFNPQKTKHALPSDMEICQSDYPLDWYQQEFLPYAEAYQALPDRDIVTIIAWMQPYIEAAKNHFGDALLLAAHYYMGGEITRNYLNILAVILGILTSWR